MPNYEYTGQFSSGAAITGVIEAATPQDAQQALEELQIHVMSVAVVARVPMARPLSREDILFFNQQLASLAKAGLALDQGLKILAKDVRRGALKQVIEGLATEIENGAPLEDAVQRRAHLFPPLYAEVLRSGVRNHQLGSTLCNLNTHLTLMDTTRRLIWEAMTYPTIVLVLGLIVLIFFLGGLVPQYEDLIRDVTQMETSDWRTGEVSRISIPWPTKALLGLGHYWQAVTITIITLTFGSALVFFLMRFSAAGRSLRESIVRHVPGIGRVYRMSLVARFTQAAALGAHAGQDLPNVLRLAAGATGSPGLTLDAEEIARQIEAGSLPAQTALRSRILPAIVTFTMQVAGARGQLAEALAELSRGYDDMARHRLVMLRVILLPFSILVVAGIFGLGVFAMFMPLIRVLNSLTGGF